MYCWVRPKSQWRLRFPSGSAKLRGDVPPRPHARSTHHLAHASTSTRAPTTSQPGGRFVFCVRKIREPPMKLTGAQALIKSLEMEEVEVMFGLPGGAILPAYDPLIDSTIRHILVRHEQGAGHMAEGYAHVTGRPGVALVTSGPAATNLVTPLCDAYMASIPMVAITGQVPTGAIGTDAFQECDTVGIPRSVTKHNELVMTPQDLPRAIKEAFHIATTGRPGPVLVDVPKDVLTGMMDWEWPEGLDLPGYKPNMAGNPKMIQEAARYILAAHQPIL